MAEKLMKANLWLTFAWILLALPSLLWWKDSILWVIVISLWANVASHFAGYLAARAEVNQLKGHNLTEADRGWIKEQLTLCQRAPGECMNLVTGSAPKVLTTSETTTPVASVVP